MTFLSPAAAQPLGGAIRGQIVTTSGLPQANVPVTAVNQETGEVRRTMSAPDGQYALSSLMPGRYRIEAEAPGFRRHLQAGIELQIGRDVRLDVRLESLFQARALPAFRDSGPIYRGGRKIS